MGTGSWLDDASPGGGDGQPRPPNRRVKLFFVSAWATRSMLGMSVGRGGVQIIPVLEGLPEGVDVQAVRYSESRDCFVFRVAHDSFPEVGDTEPIPEIHGVTVTCVEVTRPVRDADGRWTTTPRGRQWL